MEIMLVGGMYAVQHYECECCCSEPGASSSPEEDDGESPSGDKGWPNCVILGVSNPITLQPEMSRPAHD